MNLNLNEQLLIDTRNANVCIFIANLASWIRTNIDKEKFSQRNIREGKCWSYNTLEDFKNFFDFWSIQNLRTIIKQCKELGLIEINNFNKHAYDKTQWYSLTDKALEYYPILKDKIRTRSHQDHINTGLLKSTNGFDETNKPIPELPTHISNINITNSGDSSFVKTEEVINAYHETLPDSPKIKVCGNELTKQIRSMIKNWPKYQKDGNSFTIESFKDYLGYIKMHYSWLLKPYTTELGKRRCNNLTTLTREKNIVRIVNGEFNAD